MDANLAELIGELMQWAAIWIIMIRLFLTKS